MKIIFTLIFIISCSGPSMTKTGILSQDQNFSLNKCSDRPNCVGSFEDKNDKEHFIDPIKALEGKETAYKKIEQILKDLPRVKVIKKTENYMHVTFTSALMRFVDDVEFLFEDQTIHIKSASRKGYSDLGANRKRMEDIRFRFHQMRL